MSRLCVRFSLYALFFAVCLVTLSGEAPASSPAVSPAARKAVLDSFSKGDEPSVRASLTKVISSLKGPVDQRFALVSLASYEERVGFPLDAARHFQSAASDLGSRDDSLLLDAARCFLLANEVSSADAIVRSLLQSSFDERVTVRARVYSAWVQLAAGNRNEALSMMRSFAENPACAPYAPALLLTLWWSDADESAKSTLLARWPRSPEAACVRGEAMVGPSPFWYLMNRNESLVSAFATEGSTSLTASIKPASAVSPAPVATPAPAANTEGTGRGNTISARAAGKSDAEGKSDAAGKSDAGLKPGTSWQQVGFFKHEDYAGELVAKLREKGFAPIVRQTIRPSGNRYFAVLISEDDARTTASRLKDAGFESYLVVD